MKTLPSYKEGANAVWFVEMAASKEVVKSLPVRRTLLEKNYAIFLDFLLRFPEMKREDFLVEEYDPERYLENVYRFDLWFAQEGGFMQ